MSRFLQSYLLRLNHDGQTLFWSFFVLIWSSELGLQLAIIKIFEIFFLNIFQKNFIMSILSLSYLISIFCEFVKDHKKLKFSRMGKKILSIHQLQLKIVMTFMSMSQCLNKYINIKKIISMFKYSKEGSYMLSVILSESFVSYQTRWRSKDGTLWGPSFRAAHETLPAGLQGTQRLASWKSWLPTVQGSKLLVLWNSWRENQDVDHVKNSKRQRRRRKNYRVWSK